MSFKYKQHDKVRYKHCEENPDYIRGTLAEISWIDNEIFTVTYQSKFGFYIQHMYRHKYFDDLFELISEEKLSLTLPEGAYIDTSVLNECICPKSTWYVEGCKCNAGQRSLELERKERCI